MNMFTLTYQWCKRRAKLVLPARVDRLAEEYKTGIKYFISGGIAAGVDLVLLGLFTELVGVWYLFSSILAFVFSLLTSFSLHKFWTFREHSRNRLKKQFIFFTALALFGLGLNTLLLYVFVEILHIWYLIAQFFIMGGIAFMNFIINKTVTFRHKNKSSRNILLAAGIYPPDIGGPATYVRILQEELPIHGFNVKVITYSDLGKLEVRSKKLENVYYISRKQLKILRYFKYFWQVLKLLNWANIVYVQGPVSEGLPVYWACKLRGRKYILKIVGDYAWEQMQVKSKKLKVKSNSFVGLDDFQKQKFDFGTELKRRMQKKVARRASKIIVPSEYLKKIVQHWGVSAEKITVIYNKVSLSAVVEPKAKEQGEKWMVSVARLVPWKGIDTLIEVMPALLQVESNLKLLVIGDGPERKKLEEKIRQLPAPSQGSVLLLGQLPNREVISYIAAADLFVLNSGYEGLSHVIIEALAKNVPVFVSNAGGNPELVVSGKNGELFEYNNKEEIKNKVINFLQSGFTFVPTDIASFSNAKRMIEKTIKVLIS